MILLKEHKDVLQHYINTYPSRWKAEISKDWDHPLCVPPLRALRTQYGPTWLFHLTAKQIQAAQVREDNQ